MIVNDSVRLTILRQKAFRALMAAWEKIEALDYKNSQHEAPLWF